MKENEITEAVIGCDIKVHKISGSGLLEFLYEDCMDYELPRLNYLRLLGCNVGFLQS